jgi:hypothetical protein
MYVALDVVKTRPHIHKGRKFTSSPICEIMPGMVKERISHEPGNIEGWICICKNTPCGGGFYACDVNGNEVEPDYRWTSGLYVCADCGRMINPDTLEVVGRNANCVLLA